MVGTTLAVLLTALPARAAEEPAAAFRLDVCTGPTAPAGWNAVSDRWLKAAVPPSWQVADNLDRFAPKASTTTVSRLAMNVDYALKASTMPVLSLFGASAPGQPSRAPGEWLDDVLANGRDPLGRSGSVSLAGLGRCKTGAAEYPAHGACGGGPEEPCRRAAVYVDCGNRDGMEVSATLTTPPYATRGKPVGRAAEAVGEFKGFLCALQYKGPSAAK